MSWKVPPRRWAKLWWKMIGVIVTHVSSKSAEIKYCWKCPHPNCGADLEASSEKEIIDKIEIHLIEDQKNGLIK